ncbi:MAG: YafY family protein [Bacillota bacterium]|nr:YafY family protein [Bacillota bacterium]
MRLHRLIGIIMMLDSRKVIKAKDIANVLEASERTIYRDVDLLCEAGIPIVSIPGPAGGFAFMDGYKFNADSLHLKDIVNLLFSSTGINIDKNTETYQELKNAVIKLESIVPEEYKEEIAKAKEKFICDSNPWFGEKVIDKNIDIIKNAVFNLKKLKIRYKKYDGQISERIIRPYGVIVKKSELYFAAFCEERNEARIFKSNRIESAEMLEESFNIPEKFSLEEFWEESKKQFIRRTPPDVSASKTYPVKVKFYEDKKNMLQGFEVLNYEIYDRYIIYDINMISFETAFSMIFPISDRITVLEPEKLKKYIIDKAKRIIEMN